MCITSFSESLHSTNILASSAVADDGELYVQTQEANERRAAGMLLDLVNAKLDRTSFDQLVYALVQTEQVQCARMLDEELTVQCLQANGPEHG